MQPTTQTQNTLPKAPKKVSTGSSKTGAVLSVLALISAAIASGLVHSRFKTDSPVVTTSQKVGEAVGTGTWRALAAIFSIPFIVGGVALGVLAITLLIIRVKKVKATGLIFSVFWIFIAVWAVKLASATLLLMKTHSAN